MNFALSLWEALGLAVVGAIVAAAGWHWLARFRREGYRFRLHEFDDPGSGYAAVIFLLVGSAALALGVIGVGAILLSWLRWI